MYEPAVDPRPAPETQHGMTGSPKGSWLGILIAWVVIIGTAAAMIVLPGTSESAAGEAADDMGIVMSRIQGRYIVGAAQLTPGGALYEQARTEFERGSVGQRQRFVALAAELAGPVEAA